MWLPGEAVEMNQLVIPRSFGIRACGQRKVDSIIGVKNVNMLKSYRLTADHCREPNPGISVSGGFNGISSIIKFHNASKLKKITWLRLAQFTLRRRRSLQIFPLPVFSR